MKNKILSLVLAVTIMASIFCTGFSVSAETAETSKTAETAQTIGTVETVGTPDNISTGVKYDVNCDGEFNIKDASAIQLKLAKLYKGAYDKSVADANSDGTVDIKDASYIQLYLANLLPSTEATTETTTEATTEPTTEATTEATTEPTTEATTESTAESTTEPTIGRAIALYPTETSLCEGDTYDIRNVFPDYVYDIEKICSTKSDNESVAKIDEKGIVTAVSPGTATVSCYVEYAGTRTLIIECKVTVQKLATSITLNATSLTLGVGDTYTLNSSIPEGTAAKYRKYSSNNTAVATVAEADGLVTAIAPGTAAISCTMSNGVKATCKVTVKPMATSITLNASSLTLGIGETFDLNNSIPEGTATKYRKYSSSNPSVAIVAEAGGLVKAISSGTSTIYCTMSNGVSATCKVTVKPMPVSLSLDKTSLTIKVGQTYDFSSIVPSGTAAYYRKYTSNNTEVAPVKAAGGLVKANKVGTATITCTLNNGVKATCKVTVKGSIVKAIDVSNWQGTVNFKKVKADGYDYVIIRAGYGRETSQKDSMFETYYKNAKAAGLGVGAYWYSYADSVADAQKEAQACLWSISGKTFDLPVYYDMEDSSMTSLGKTTLTNIALKFCENIEKSGYKAGVYANTNWFTKYLDKSKISAKYSTWLAKIDGDFSTVTDDLHQYTFTGKVNGVSGNVDCDYIYNLNIIRK